LISSDLIKRNKMGEKFGLVLAMFVFLSVLPVVLAVHMGNGLTPDIGVEEFGPKVWMCGDRIVLDDNIEPWRASEGGSELFERFHNYAFEGEQIVWTVLVMDKNKIDQFIDVYATVGPSQSGSGGTGTITRTRDITFCDSIPLTNTNWDDNIVLNKFNSSLGDLVSAEIELATEITNSISIENQDLGPITVTLNSEGIVNIYSIDSSVVTSNIFISEDFVADQGINTFNVSNVSLDNYFVSNLSMYVSSVGDSTFNLLTNASATAQLSGSGNFIGGVSTQASAQACITYTYEFEVSVPNGEGNDIEVNCVRSSADNNLFYGSADFYFHNENISIPGSDEDLEITVEEDDVWFTWTFDFPVENWQGDGQLPLALIIAKDGIGEGPAFQIHNNDGTDASYDWGTWLMSPWGPTIADGWNGWHSGSNNTLVGSIDWAEAGGEYYAQGEDGVLTIRIKKEELGSTFHWSAYPQTGAGWFSPYKNQQMPTPSGFTWSSPVVGSDNYHEASVYPLRDNLFNSCNARIQQEYLEWNPDTMAFFDCTFTVETPQSMYGEYFITVEAMDGTGLMGAMDENEYWFLNPVIALSIDGYLEFDEVRPGTDTYSNTILVGNDADFGSGVMLDMFISGTDFYDSSSSGTRCPTTNQLSLKAFRYFATSGAYSSYDDKGNDRDVDDEGYVEINYGNVFSNVGNSNNFYDSHEILQAGGGYMGKNVGYNANVLSPGAEMALTFKLSLPEPCNGDFDTGSIFFWGEAI
jgi:hypothetical protein